MYGVREGKGGGLNVSMAKYQDWCQTNYNIPLAIESYLAKLRIKAEKSTPVRGITKSYAQSAWIEKGCRSETTHAINLMHLMKTQA